MPSGERTETTVQTIFDEKSEIDSPLVDSAGGQTISTPIINSILESMSAQKNSDSQGTEEILRKSFGKFGHVEFSLEICIGMVDDLLQSRMKKDFSPRVWRTISRSVASSLMNHDVTRARLENLWRLLGGK